MLDGIDVARSRNAAIFTCDESWRSELEALVGESLAEARIPARASRVHIAELIEMIWPDLQILFGRRPVGANEACDPASAEQVGFL
ncbi:hypothetical protein NPA31_014400 [Aurantimonas sp. MSK8Z-1]|uniref:hypothetical protein n=1 Tax=Mangrovibrevibacter kandeliae TaxID=2968473 RepID=UPI0021195623|nr:hypothetical protein [Aurantimonas sp. MSK8Z-1]MCW4116154.1 hypothetical protein [Aurantimonas sp. MSK8Z-1]